LLVYSSTFLITDILSEKWGKKQAQRAVWAGFLANILMIIALIYLIYMVVKKQVPGTLLAVYIVNIIANLLFTPIQLVLQNTWLATLDILVVLGTLAYLLYKIWPKSKITFALLAPYLLWGTFATILQITILAIN